MARWSFELTHHLVLAVPLWMLGLHLMGRKRHVGWWWMVAGLMVSWLADSASDLITEPADRWPVMIAYPVLQVSLIGSALLTRRDAILFLLTLLVAAGVAVITVGAEGPDVLFSAVAFLGLAGIVWDRWNLGRLRLALLVEFGGGWLCLLGYAIWPGWASWIVYQSVRYVGLGAFCWAAWKPEPSLRLEAA